VNTNLDAHALADLPWQSLEAGASTPLISRFQYGALLNKAFHRAERNQTAASHLRLRS